jgi:hypothetical protein
MFLQGSAVTHSENPLRISDFTLRIAVKVAFGLIQKRGYIATNLSKNCSKRAKYFFIRINEKKRAKLSNKRKCNWYISTV